MNKSESKYFNTAIKMDQALISLLKKKSFEYITVSEICKTAEVNRSTFYLHYETINDLLEETVQYLLNDFLSYYSTNIQMVSLNYGQYALNELIFITDKYLIPYLNYIKDHQEVFETALSQSKIFGLEHIHERMFDNIFNPILERFNYPKNNRTYVMMYYLNGINAVVLEWLRNNCDKSIDEMVDIINICIYGTNK